MSGADWAILLVLSVLWGGSFFFIEVAIPTVAPLTLVLIRVALAAALLWAFLLVAARAAGVAAGRGLGLSGACVAQQRRPVQPVRLGAGGDHRRPRLDPQRDHADLGRGRRPRLHRMTRKRRPAKVAGVLLGFAGVAVMIGADLLGQIGANALAQLACLAATLCYALAGVWARRFRGMGVPPIAVSTGQLSAAAIVMLPLVLVFEPPWLAAAPSAEAWWALIALALFCTSLAYILYFRLLASAGATNSLLVTFLIPITAILLGALLLGERLEPRHFAGMALIGAGLAAIDGRSASAAIGRRIVRISR